LRGTHLGMIPNQDAPDRRPVVIDSCAVNRFALLNIDPTKNLEGSPFYVAYTPGLRAEYRKALAHRFVEPHIRTLLAALLEKGVLVRAESSEADTDGVLAALSETEIVITMDRRPPWNRAQDNAGLIFWPDIEGALREHGSLLPILSARAAAMRLR
jgi:hypothetical protein